MDNDYINYISNLTNSELEIQLIDEFKQIKVIYLEFQKRKLEPSDDCRIKMEKFLENFDKE